MTRLRYSRAEAEAEATRRAIEFVNRRPDRDALRHCHTSPDSFGTPSRSSKHPVSWVAVFAPVMPEGAVIDGGELFVAVDLESGAIVVRSF